MQFPLSFWDLSHWLAVTAVILLITAELISSSNGKVNILINKKHLGQVALIITILFLLTLAISIFETVTAA